MSTYNHIPIPKQCLIFLSMSLYKDEFFNRIYLYFIVFLTIYEIIITA